MAIDSKDIIYIFDRGNDRIQKVTTDGKPLGALYSYDGEWLTNKYDIPLEPKPIKEKKFASSEAMAIDKDGNYYVTDTGHTELWIVKDKL
jgi:sugar lactone lactonase YvrE